MLPFRASDVPHRLTAAAAGFAAGAVGVDGGGLLVRSPELWAVGSWLHLAAVALLGCAVLAAAACAVAGRGRWPGARGGVLLLLSLFLLGVGRWIRGHPEVPPDPPIVAAAVMAAALLLFPLFRGRRKSGTLPAEAAGSAEA